MSDDDASFRLLGPLEVRLGDRIVDLSPLERDLVAALALSANTAVSLDRIVDLLRMWAHGRHLYVNADRASIATVPKC